MFQVLYYISMISCTVGTTTITWSEMAFYICCAAFLHFLNKSTTTTILKKLSSNDLES